MEEMAALAEKARRAAIRRLSQLTGVYGSLPFALYVLGTVRTPRMLLPIRCLRHTDRSPASESRKLSGHGFSVDFVQPLPPHAEDLCKQDRGLDEELPDPRPDLRKMTVFARRLRVLRRGACHHFPAYLRRLHQPRDRKIPSHERCNRPLQGEPGSCAPENGEEPCYERRRDAAEA